MNERNKKLSFKPKARIIRTIGDQLISGPEAAIIELVKNSYDADASFVSIKFFPPLVAGEGRIEVSDDGHGMSIDDIRLKWMEPATSSKSLGRVSNIKKRKMMGSKGIGRFATAKLGGAMSLVSTASRNDKLETILIPEIDWSIFSEDVYLSDIEIDYISQPASECSGTLIEIRNLSENWTKNKLVQLHLELRRLISPIEPKLSSEDEFRIYLDLSECTKERCGFDGPTLITKNDTKNPDEKHRVLPFPLLTSSDYELIGSFNGGGAFEGTFQIKRAGRGLEKIYLNIPEEENTLSPGAFQVHLSLFDRESEAIKNNMREAGMGDLSALEARKILDSISGISIYRDGFRIRPYGDGQNDWLALDSRRVQNPSMKIGRNQVSGIITVGSQHESNLFERSSREGFEDNEAFQRLTELVLKLLDKIVEPKRYKFRSDSGISRKRDATFEEAKELAELKKIRKFVALLEPEEREKAEKVITEQSHKLSDRIEQLQERHRVLEAQSSLGAIVGEVLHEGGPAARYVAEAGDQLLLRLKSLLEPSSAGYEASKKVFVKKLPFVKDYGVQLNSLFKNLEPLAGGKRGKPSFFFPVATMLSATELFTSHNIPIHIDNQTDMIELVGYQGDLSTAAINIIGNAIHWLEEHKTADPVIKISILADGANARILIEDNGPGVPEEFVDEIFDVGFSLKNYGTGLGLNIAREALSRSGATLLFHPDFSAGALFEIVFPAKKVK